MPGSMLSSAPPASLFRKWNTSWPMPLPDGKRHLALERRIPEILPGVDLAGDARGVDRQPVGGVDLAGQELVPEGRMHVREIRDAIVLPLHQQVPSHRAASPSSGSRGSDPTGAAGVGRSRSDRGLRPGLQMNLVPCASVNGTANVSENHFLPRSAREQQTQLLRHRCIGRPASQARHGCNPGARKRGIPKEATATDCVFEVHCHGSFLLCRVESDTIILEPEH